ncbi:hypothetical protein AGR4C_Cc180058 [Agrobacterium tumefaciens str. Kerr 14]|uniref:Uncharacterized protein n=1 Tax=Agrobacterium tumefaciens str. Kerr 14 TaxID=1183424 RepID=A0A1S7PJ14_AGRTU|nr:hypothetical protein AGR4C_Cc180058 [Agrobacterium tumefaciens str. Kerr 14]
MMHVIVLLGFQPWTNLTEESVSVFCSVYMLIRKLSKILWFRHGAEVAPSALSCQLRDRPRARKYMLGLDILSQA